MNAFIHYEHCSPEKKGVSMDGHNSRFRFGTEIGLVITLGLFVITVVYNVGIQSGKLQDIKRVQEAHTLAINVLQQGQLPINERMARVEALLSDIRDNMRDQNRKTDAYRKKRQ